MGFDEFKKHFELDFSIDKFDKENRYIAINGKESTSAISKEALEKVADHFNYESFLYTFEFENCKFADIKFKKSKHFYCLLKFKNCTFEESVDFSDCKFGANKNGISLVMLHCEFKGEVKFYRARFCGSADFNGSKFKGDVYFHRAIFESDLQMYNAQFDRVVNFYYATFDGVPNFSAAVFDKQHHTNFIGMKIDALSYENIKEYICKRAELDHKKDRDENKDKHKTIDDYLVQHAENVKDSFAVVKQNLIAKNNLIEANKYRVLELYAEEIKLGNIGINYKGYKSIKKRFSSAVDEMLLRLYRITSDHHNNITMMLSFLLFVIAVYGLCMYFATHCDLGAIKQAFENNKKLSSAITFLVFFTLFAFFVFKGAAKRKSYFIVAISLITPCLIFALNFGVFDEKFIYFGDSLFYFVVIVLYLTLHFLYFFIHNILNCYKLSDLVTFIKYLVNVCCFIVFILFVIEKPDIIIPYTAIFRDFEKIFESEPYVTNAELKQFFSIITFIYSIFFTLCLYSLQKTARKNSIVPN